MAVSESYFAAVQIPFFVAQAHDLYLTGEGPLVVLAEQGSGRRIRVSAVNQQAQQVGISEGELWHGVERRFPATATAGTAAPTSATSATAGTVETVGAVGIELRHCVYNERKVHDELQRLKGLCELFTPDYEVFADGLLSLNLTGTQRLYDHNLRHWWERFQKYMQQYHGVRVVIGHQREIAGLLARSGMCGSWKYVKRGEEQKHLDLLPVDLLFQAALPGVDRKVLQRLKESGLFLFGDLRAQGRAFVQLWFQQSADAVMELLEGRSALVSTRKVQTTKAFQEKRLEVRALCEDAESPRLEARCRLLADELSYLLRQKHLLCRKLCLSIEYADGISERKFKSLGQGTADYCRLSRVVLELYREQHSRRIALRSLCLEALQLMQDEGQLDLFAESNKRNQKIRRSLDQIRKRNGFSLIVNGDALL